MISTRLFQAISQRGAMQALMTSQTGLYKTPVRFFAQRDSDGEEPAAVEPEVAEPAAVEPEAAEPEAVEHAEPEPAPQPEPEPVQAAPQPTPPAAAPAMEKLDLDRSLF